MSHPQRRSGSYIARLFRPRLSGRSDAQWPHRSAWCTRADTAAAAAAATLTPCIYRRWEGVRVWKGPLVVSGRPQLGGGAADVHEPSDVRTRQVTHWRCSRRPIIRRTNAGLHWAGILAETVYTHGNIFCTSTGPNENSVDKNNPDNWQLVCLRYRASKCNSQVQTTSRQPTRTKSVKSGSRHPSEAARACTP